jgi:hypothetical protein
MREGLRDASDELFFTMDGDSDTAVEMFMYVDRSNSIAGFGMSAGELGEYGFLIEAVAIEGVGYYLIVNADDTHFEESIFLKLYGNLSDGNVVSGDLNIQLNYYDFWTGLVEVSGRILTFEYDDNRLALFVSGRDILNLAADLGAPRNPAYDVLRNLEFDLIFTHADNGDHIALVLRHLNPEVELAIRLGIAYTDSETPITVPSGANVVYVDVLSLMDLSEEAMMNLLFDIVNPLELVANAHQILENLSRKGFDFTHLLWGLF